MILRLGHIGSISMLSMLLIADPNNFVRELLCKLSKVAHRDVPLPKPSIPVVDDGDPGDIVVPLKFHFPVKNTVAEVLDQHRRFVQHVLSRSTTNNGQPSDASESSGYGG